MITQNSLFSCLLHSIMFVIPVTCCLSYVECLLILPRSSTNTPDRDPNSGGKQEPDPETSGKSNPDWPYGGNRQNCCWSRKAMFGKIALHPCTFLIGK